MGLDPRSIYHGPFGLRAGWGVAIYAVAFGIVFVITNFMVFYALQRRGRLPFMHYEYYALLLLESIVLIAAVAATWLMSRIERTPLASYWGRPLAPSAMCRAYLIAAVVGAALVAAYVGIIFTANAYRIGTPELQGWRIVLYGGAWLVVSTVYGVADTILMFGYPLFTLRRSVGPWLSSAAVALLFALRHVVWFDASVIGCSALIVQGLFLCAVTFRHSRLMVTAGVYAGSIFAQCFLFSVSDGGTLYTGHLRDSYLEGRYWLTGVSGGPSLPALFVYLSALLFLLLIRRSTKTVSGQQPTSCG